MASKITKIKELSSEQNHPVILENFGTYLEHRQHDMKCLLAHDRSSSTLSESVGNVLLVTGEKQMYYGHIKVKPAEQTDLLHTFVARRNRTTGKMRLYEVRSSTLMHVSHDRASYDQANPEIEERRLQNLQRKFNTKLAESMDRKRYNRIDLSMMADKLQSLMAETVVKNVEETEMATSTAASDDMQQELYAKANPNAKTLANLYDARQVIGAEVWHNLTESARKLLEIPAEYLRMANSYLGNKVKAIMQSNEPATEPNLAVVRTCIYMDVLVQLTGPKVFQLTRKGKSVSSFTKVLDGPIRQSFMQHVQGVLNSENQVTKFTRKKARLYYLALLFALEARDVVDLNLIHQSLEISRNELTMYGTMVGARYLPKYDHFIIGKIQPKVEVNDNDVLRMLQGPRRFKRSFHK